MTTKYTLTLAMLGETVGAADALRLGLVSKLVPRADLEAETARLARRLADGPPLALARTKRLLRDSAGASLVELDLVLQGQPTLDYSREGLPDWDYAVSVTRSSKPEQYEIYTATLQKRLPRFRLPLAADDRDTVLDLQSTFGRCFDQGNFTALIDYKRDPATRLSDDNRRWLDQLLKQQKLR